MKDYSNIVLIISDDSVAVPYLQTFIPLIGNFQVVVAATPVEGLAKANALEPILTFYDQDLSKIPSKQVLKEFKKRYAKMPVLISIANEQDIDWLKKEKMMHFVRKPCDLTELGSKIKELLPLVSDDGPLKEYARLLIADDESAISDLLKDDFQELGIEVYTANNGKDAFQKFQESNCNLAIIDLKMPDINGIDLIKLLESSAQPPQPKAIILITAGFGTAISELRTLHHPVVMKPVELRVLEHLVLEACEKNHLALKK